MPPPSGPKGPERQLVGTMLIIQDALTGDLYSACQTQEDVLSFLRVACQIDKPELLSPEELENRFSLVVRDVPIWA